MSKININNFDFLRVLFASTVAIAHLIELSDLQILQPYLFFFNTRLAINGFFIISGFLIAKSYESSKTIKDYFKKRIKRIVPAYFFLILVCTLLFSLISTESTIDYFLDIQFWRYLLANLTFQNYIEPCLPGVFKTSVICNVNSALWTIKIEEAFYLVVPLFYYVLKLKKGNVYLLCSLIFVLSVCYFNYFVSIDLYRIAKQLPGAMAFFISGILFYKKFTFFVRLKNYFIIPCLLLFILEQYIFSTHLIKPLTYGFTVFYFAYSFKWLNNFGKYGDFTYGIYIYHFPIIQLFVYFGIFEMYNPFVSSFIILLTIIILSVLSWYFLELVFLSESRKKRQKEMLSTKLKN